MRNRLLGSVVVCLALALFGARRAEATFHEMKIVEVFPGSAAAPTAQYVVLQMWAAGQNSVSGHTITVYNAAGAAIGTMMFSANMANGANQDKILIASAAAETLFGITANLQLNTTLPVAGGKVCFENIDCVSWGNYTGTDVGTPWNRVPPSGLVLGHSIARRLDITGSNTVLDVGDDTNNSINDFVLATPAPKNNARQTGTTPSSTCHNNTVEGLEECDDNNANNNDGCSSTCTLERCGDQLVNNGNETCDDANTVNGDGCDNNCTTTACGNGIITAGEVCDDGDVMDGNGCDSNCKPTGCGNGIVTQGETCDDGNLTSGDDCDSNCTPTGCGNGIITAGEACEPPSVGTCDMNCQRSCVIANDCADTDPCTSNETCQNDMTCAVSPTPTDDNEPCTIDGCDMDGVFHNALVDGTACTLAGMAGVDALCVSGVCKVEGCGDGFLDVTASEECDDGNDVDNDDCTNACTEPACGDSIVQMGEECDDGNAAVNDGCGATCLMETCGDLLQQASESCDDGNMLNDDGCSSTCATESCGDGVVQLIEECDDGNTSSNDGCSANCRNEGCGDGNLQAGEDCDDGNTEDGDNCSSTCKKPDDGGCCDTGTDPSWPVFAFSLVVLGLVTRRKNSRATV